MAYRKLLLGRCCERIEDKDDICYRLNLCHNNPVPPSPPPPPSPQAPPLPSTNAHIDYRQRNVMFTGMTVMLSVALLLGIFCALVRFYFNRGNHSRRRSSPFSFGTRDDFLGEDGGPHTVGLQQSVINSITVFKYKKDQGLIEGTECSVCLNEFQEDESLRHLPKCSHAFHLPCIDTWLRSHKNCPLCRAPVVCETMVAQASASEPNSIDSGSRNETVVENSEIYGVGLGRNDVGEGGTSELRTCPIEDGNTFENSKKSLVHSKTRSSDSQVLTDLAGVQDVAQPIRRSVSLDLSSAEIYGVGLGRNDVGEGGTSELRTCPIEDGNTFENSKKSLVHSKTRSSDSQVLTDLAGVQDVAQPIRRSVSLDLSSAEIYGVGLGRNDVGEGGTSELRTCPIEDGNTFENSKKSLVHSKTRSSDSQVLTDLAGVQDVAQPIRRSVSLDLSSALEIYSDVAGLATAAHKHNGSSDTELQHLKYPKGKIVVKQSSGSSSICKLMKSSSFGRSLSKEPISMKRSLSSDGKFLVSKQSRRQDSVLPL